VLQHGSILIDLDADLLFALLRFPNERARERLRASFENRAVAINELRERSGLPRIGIAEAEEAFFRGMQEGMGIRLEEGELTPDELRLAEQLAREKYATDEWNLRR
jgi:lipoate-protein ligase A